MTRGTPGGIGAQIKGVRAELAAFDTDPGYRADVLARHRADLLYELGRLTWERYRQIAATERGGEALAAAREALREARSALPRGEGSGLDIAWWLGFATIEGYRRDGDPAGLDAIVDLFTEITDSPDADPEDRAHARYRIAQARLERYGAAGDPADLAGAIEAAESAARYTPPDQPPEWLAGAATVAEVAARIRSTVDS